MCSLKERLEIYRTGQEQIPHMKKGALEIFLDMDINDAVKLFGVPSQTVYNWRSDKTLPVEKAALIIENLEDGDV